MLLFNQNFKQEYNCFIFFKFTSYIHFYIAVIFTIAYDTTEKICEDIYIYMKCCRYIKYLKWWRYIYIYITSDIHIHICVRNPQLFNKLPVILPEKPRQQGQQFFFIKFRNFLTNRNQLITAGG